ncbi:MAG TPA: hypothetical protein VN932_02835 [Rhizomicrobium sp.]|nr:hypothetical protein [Rhizomicrobium sp.]
MKELGLRPVPNRQCGECNACCRYLTVNTTEIVKLPNVLCGHWKGGCTIHENWPTICRDFFCGWRLFDNLSDAWRPDRSNILVQLHAPTEAGPAADLILLGPLGDSMTGELLNYIAALIEAGYRAFLALPGPPGHFVRKIFLNNAMAPAMAARDIEQAQAALQDAIRKCTALPTEPIVMGPPAELRY